MLIVYGLAGSSQGARTGWRKQLERVQTAAWDPADAVEAVTFAFYAYENGIVAVAEAKGIAWTKNHPDKAKVARQLVSRGILKTDVHDLLVKLNDLRKDVAYGEPGQDLEQLDLEDLATDLERFLDEVEQAL